jgi:hypothetical protein
MLFLRAIITPLIAIVPTPRSKRLNYGDAVLGIVPPVVVGGGVGVTGVAIPTSGLPATSTPQCLSDN